MTRSDIVALGDTLAEALIVLDIQRYAYLLMPDGVDATPRLISNYPSAWTARYLERSYEATDPVIVEAGKTPRSFLWGPGADLNLRSNAREFFEEAARFGIRCGFTIPLYDGRPHVATLTLAADTRQPTFDRAIERYEATLQLIATLFHRAARRVLTPNRVIDGITLTPREYECLAWSAKGKTAWEISVILRIARRTVVYHLENAKHKLGVFSIAEAVARLVVAASEF